MTGRRYRLELSDESRAFAEQVGGACRFLWNIALEQRRFYSQRGDWAGYAQQCRELTEARQEFDWLRSVPVHCLQQTLRDLDKACRRHGTGRVRWKSKARAALAFRFPDPRQFTVQRLNRKWGRVKLPKFGWVSFRYSRPLAGEVKSATVVRDADRWFISFAVEDGVETPNHVKTGTDVGVDRGVVTAAVTSNGEFFDRRHVGAESVSSKIEPDEHELLEPRDYLSSGEQQRLIRLQRRLARCQKGSNRRLAVKRAIGTLMSRARLRRADFNAQVAHRLACDFETVVLEKLNTAEMTASARGTLEAPGRSVAQKAGLNRAVLNKGWHGLEVALRAKGRYTGTSIVVVNPAYTSQTCSDCGCVDVNNRESQGLFSCTACGHTEHADVNAGKVIKARGSAGGLSVAGRGDLQASARSEKRQPSGVVPSSWAARETHRLQSVGEVKVAGSSI